MKHISTLLLLLLSAQLSFAQIQWEKNYEAAKRKAVAEKKFIVMDFWATWCGPCKNMDKNMWEKSDMAAVNEKFIFLKIDVDYNQDIAQTYNAKSIPKVVIMDPLGDVIWERVGFSSATPYMKAFADFPEVAPESNYFIDVLNKRADENTMFSLAAWYQNEGKRIENPYVSKGLLGLSDKYFKDLAKNKQSATLATEAEFNLILNQAYKGSIKKAMKKVEKMDEAEMKNFILAYCYKCDGQTEKMQEFIDKIKSEELLAQLK